MAREWRVDYEPGESNSSSVRRQLQLAGADLVPDQFSFIEALERYHHFYGDDLKVEFPTRSGKMLTLMQVARQLSIRLVHIFMPDSEGRRPCHGTDDRYAKDPNWKDLLLFHEYFSADTGRGCGASHQTGWTALVARMISGMAPAGTDATAMPQTQNLLAELTANPIK